jgi:signal transduction histidine kinase/CheY-like chemotaxis protein
VEPGREHSVPESLKELPSSRRRPALHVAATRALAEAATVGEGVRRVLGMIGDAEGWAAAMLLLPLDTGDRLGCAELWCTPELERFCRETTAARGEGHAGRAWATGRPIFVADVSHPAGRARAPRDTGEDEGPRERLQRHGIRAVASLPVAARGETRGVLLLVGRSPRDPDPASEDVLASIAAQLGLVLRGQAAEQALARSEDALRRSEAQVLGADRLASLGALAAGVAHEINNPLSYVLLILELLVRDLGAEGEVGARLVEARSGLERVKLIVQDLKSFSRIDAERRERVDVRRVLDSTIEIAQNEIRHRALLIRDFGEVPPVMADPSRLGQVFLNLLVNAVQAMSEGDVSRNEIRVTADVDRDGRVVVAIADSGSGIPPEILGRIFDPFFTTKPPGVGTGLGLSICKGIITAIGGEIAVTSKVSEGTTFRVALPPALEPAQAPAAPLPAKAPSGAPKRGRVLVIDDEPVLARALGRSLAPEYDVVVISNPADALDRLRLGEGFDAILCDLVMPQVTGMDLYAELAASRPALAARMIFMTGGTFTVRAREFLAAVPNPAIDKPFDLAALSALLRARVGSRP